MGRLWPERSANPPRWWAQLLAVVAVGVWVALYLATGALDGRAGAFGHALSIALGTEDPFQSHRADIPAVALAVVSWLLVPAAVGATAALLLEEQLMRSRPLTMEDVEREMTKLREELRG